MEFLNTNRLISIFHTVTLSLVRSLPLIIATGLIIGYQPSYSAPPSALTDVNPDGNPGEPRFGGRSLGLTINPTNANIVYVASELGGFFSSADGGTNWTHIDDIPIPQARDIMFDPQDANILIASGRYDGRVNSLGGIWQSPDGGATWVKPATSNPGCTTEPQTWGISIPNDPVAHVNVYVATSCGIAVSADSGVTWTHVDPCTAADAAYCSGSQTYFDVEAQVVGGNVQVDACGDEGHFRSTDGGATWSAPDPNSPTRRTNGGSFNPCRVTTAPMNSNTLYLANYSGRTPAGFCISRLVESINGGLPGSFVTMGVTDSNCRDPWVVTHPDLGGDPNIFEVYFGTTQKVTSQTCDITNNPRCLTAAANWAQVDSGAHADPSDIAFDPSIANGCPLVLSTDGGISTSADCGATWQDGNRGLHALDIVGGLAGTINAGTTDLYIATQDNGIYASVDNATTWTRPVGADGYNVLADRAPPARVFYRRCFGCNDFIANPGIVGAVAFTDPPGTIGTFAVVTQFGPQSYAFVTSDGGMPALWTVYVTIDEGATWTQMGPNSLPGNPGEIRASGPAASPTFYLRLNVGGTLRIYQLSGPLNNTATLSLANAGLSVPRIWNVDSSDPTRLYAYDTGIDQVMFSIDSGTTWNPDIELSELVTRNGEFRFDPGAWNNQVSAIGLDPNSNTIMVGTRTGGLLASVNDGDSWHVVTGADDIPFFREFFFDQSDGAIYAATRGRGIWRIDLPVADLSVTKADNPDPVPASGILTYTITVENDGPDSAFDIDVIDTLPDSVSFISASPGCAEAAGIVTCIIGEIMAGQQSIITIDVLVPDDLVDDIGMTTITNDVSVKSLSTPDPDVTNNSATEDTKVLPGCAGLLATIIGTPGNEPILGTTGDDVIAGLAGNDQINGRGGNDAICGGTGNDNIVSLGGNDILNGGSGDDNITSGKGNDQINGGAGDDHIVGGAGDDDIDAGTGSDRVVAGTGNDTIDTGSGNDRIVGGSGDDNIDAGADYDLVNGGPGTDNCLNGELVVGCE